MTPERRRELEARRDAKRLEHWRRQVRQWMRENYPRATFGQRPDDRADQIFRALGR